RFKNPIIILNPQLFSFLAPKKIITMAPARMGHIRIFDIPPGKSGS
ncbi:unnamed protein product, partial [marine sediment metagenome]